MTNQEIAFQLRQITQNGNINLPESIDFELSDGILKVGISDKGVCANMQSNESAFEGWALCLKAWLPDLIDKVSIFWNATTPKSDTLHYERFKYRVWKFHGLRLITTLGNAMVAEISGKETLATIPKRAHKNPIGKIKTAPHRNPRLAVLASLAPQAICTGPWAVMACVIITTKKARIAESDIPVNMQSFLYFLIIITLP